MKKSSRYGFTVIEAIIIIGIIAILGLLGVIAYNQLTAKKTTGSAQTSDTNVVTGKEQTTDTTSPPSASEAQKYVQDFYNAYIPSSDQTSIVSKYATSDFAASYKASTQTDTVTCTTRGYGLTVKFANTQAAIQSGTSYSVNALLTVANSGGTESTTTLLVTVVAGTSGLAISNVTCPQP